MKTKQSTYPKPGKTRSLNGRRKGASFRKMTPRNALCRGVFARDDIEIPGSYVKFFKKEGMSPVFVVTTEEMLPWDVASNPDMRWRQSGVEHRAELPFLFSFVLKQTDNEMVFVKQIPYPLRAKRWVSGILPQQFVPSMSLVREFVESTARKFSCPQPSPSEEEEMLAQVPKIISDAVHGTFGTLAFRAAARGDEIVQISNWRGEFVGAAQQMLHECFPVSPYDIGELLRELHEELVIFASRAPVLGDWGSLRVAPIGLILDVTAQAPQPPATKNRPRFSRNVNTD